MSQGTERICLALVDWGPADYSAVTMTRGKALNPTHDCMSVQAWLFTLAFVAMVVWLHAYDIYNLRFTQAGPIYIIYHFWKIISVAYLVWLVCACGLAILDFADRRAGTLGLDSLDRVIAAFYIGGSAIAVVMYVLGFLNLYYTPVVLILAAPVMLLSYNRLQRETKAPGREFRRAYGTPGFGMRAALPVKKGYREKHL